MLLLLAVVGSAVIWFVMANKIESKSGHTTRSVVRKEREAYIVAFLGFVLMLNWLPIMLNTGKLPTEQAGISAALFFIAFVMYALKRKDW